MANVGIFNIFVAGMCLDAAVTNHIDGDRGTRNMFVVYTVLNLGAALLAWRLL